MYHRFHDRFGTAGVVIGVIALIVALGGTAFAATKLNPTQKKEVTKIAKKYAGKPGAAGAAGANGTNGTNGAKGDTGSTGAPGTNGNTVLNGTVNPTAGIGSNGDFYLNTTTQEIWGPKATGAWPGTGVKLKGTNGTNGTNGSTVLNGTVDPGTGVGTTGDFYINTTTDEIFGPKGASTWPTPGTKLQGEEGPAGPITGILPKGVTLTGVWAARNPSFTEPAIVYESFSYGLTLPSAPEWNFLKAGEKLSGHCEGTAATPTAVEGNVCIYTQEAEEVKSYPTENLSSATKSGVALAFFFEAGTFAKGSWAVTAP